MTNLTYRSSSTPSIPGASSVKGSPLTNLEVDANFKALDTAKQDVLISGTTLKTVGGNSLLGSGDIAVVSNVDNTTLTNNTMKSYKEFVNTVTVTTSTANLDLSTGNVFDITLNPTTSCLFTFINPPSSGTLQSAMVILRQGGTGTKLASFTNAKWTDGNAPILSTAAGAIDVLQFFTVNAGAMYFGTFSMANVS